jgi:cytochrome P450
LNERISQSVWNESCEQAQIMLQYLEKNPGDQTLFGLRTIAINVLGQAGYGQTERWSPEANGTEIDPNQDLKSGRAAYFIMTTLIADLFLQAAFLPTKLLKMPFMSPKQQLLGRYLENAPRFTKEILNEERQALREKSTPRNSFLSMLVHQSDKETSSGSTGLSLSEHEIQGNLFILSTAGYESTGNTMGYAVILLSAYPEWQMWVRDELQHLDAEASKWKYEEVFTKCPRTLAVMVWHTPYTFYHR